MAEETEQRVLVIENPKTEIAIEENNIVATKDEETITVEADV